MDKLRYFFDGIICPQHIRTLVSEQTITLVNINRFSLNLTSALILWRSGLGLLIGEFRQLLTELFGPDMIMAGYYCCQFFCCFLFFLKYFMKTFLLKDTTLRKKIRLRDIPKVKIIACRKKKADNI